MISALYLEESVAHHPRAQALMDRFPDVPHISCQRYGEVFNRRGQDFRLQKEAQPALILAEKRERKVLPTPPGYGIGGQANYYFSHVLNCLYDCRYCFLQGLYQSANYVFFLNFEDFQMQIDEILEQHPRDESVYFFSGYDGDSFALETLTGFVENHLEFFRDRPRAVLELRTKSLRVRDLLDAPPLNNAIVAFSLTPGAVSRQYEIGVPPLEKRLAAMAQLAQRGWPVGLRFDPIIAHQGFENAYEDLFASVFSHVSPEQVHSATLGMMRFPKAIHRKMTRLYPEEPLLAAQLDRDGDQVSFASSHVSSPLDQVRQLLLDHLPENKLFTH